MSDDFKLPGRAKTIDITPSWGQVGVIFGLLLDSDKLASMKIMYPEIAKACAMATAMNEVVHTSEQWKLINEVIERELARQKEALPHFNW